jgi:hypothetical protein
MALRADLPDISPDGVFVVFRRFLRGICGVEGAPQIPYGARASVASETVESEPRHLVPDLLR